MLWFMFGYALVTFWFAFGYSLVMFWFCFGLCLVLLWFVFGCRIGGAVGNKKRPILTDLSLSVL